MTGQTDPRTVAPGDRVRVTTRRDACTGVVDRAHGGGLYRVAFDPTCRHGDGWVDVAADGIEPAPDAAP